MFLFYKEATCKSSTKKGLLYAHENPEEREKGMLSDQPWLSRVTSTALLSPWGWQLLKDMTSLGTDFEMHAIWQGFVEGPVAKDFVARKACTIALSKVQGTQQSTFLLMSLEIPWEFLTRAVLCSLAGLMSRKKVSVWGFLWVSKVWFAFALWMFAPKTFGKRRKEENYWYWVNYQVPMSILLQETHLFCARYMGAHVRRTSLECQRLEKQDKKLDSHAAKKGVKKLVSSDFCKNTQIRM